MSTQPIQGSSKPPFPSAFELSLRTAIFMLPSMTIVGLCFGKYPKEAILGSLSISVVGIISWNLYRHVSRRSDGLLFLGLYTLPACSHGSFTRHIVVGLVCMIPIALLMGYWNRVPPSKIRMGGDTDPILD